MRELTYSATTARLNTVVVEFAAAVGAFAADISSDGNAVVETSIRVGWRILKHGDVSVTISALANTKVDGSKVTKIGTIGAPQTSFGLVIS